MLYSMLRRNEVQFSRYFYVVCVKVIQHFSRVISGKVIQQFSRVISAKVIQKL